MCGNQKANWFDIAYILTLQHHNQPKKYEEALDYLNIIFTTVFTIEFVLKLFAFRIKVSCSVMAANVMILDELLLHCSVSSVMADELSKLDSNLIKLI